MQRAPPYGHDAESQYLIPKQPGSSSYPGDRGKSGFAPPWLETLTWAAAYWVIFSCVCLFFGLLFHNNELQIWSLVSLSAFVIGMSAWMSWREYMNGSIKARNHFVYAMWLLLTIMFASLVGIFAYDMRIRHYWLSQELEARANVIPSEPAGAYENVGEIVFADEARLDVGRSLGYKDVRRYCVAPIAGDVPADKVQFWAAGLDCCSARGNFQCDDAPDRKARSGIVLRDWGQLTKDKRPYYMKAVKQAEVVYDIASAKEPIFVQWISDPDKVESKIWWEGMTIILAAIIFAPLFCGMTAFSIAPMLHNTD